MRLYIAASLLIGLFVADSARAQTYVEFYEIPGNPSLHGLDYHDGFLWVAVRGTAVPRILQIDPADGSVVDEVLVMTDITLLGVTWDGTDFWVSESFTSSPELFRVGSDGTILDQIPAPSQLSNGLSFRDDTLWVANAYPDKQASLVGVSPTDGSTLDTIPFPSTQPAGIAFLGDGTLWTTNVGDDSGSDIEVLWRLDRATGAVLDTLEMPTGAGRPRGLAYDGSQFLYAVMDEPGGFDDVIYKIDLSTEGTPVYTDNATTLDFDTTLLGETESLSFTITNGGDGPLEISEVEIIAVPEQPDVFSTDFSGTTLGAGENVVVTVSFAPMEFDLYTAFLAFETNDVANPRVEIPLIGVGVFEEQHLGFVVSEHDFGDVRIEDPYSGGRSAALWPLQLINQGSSPLTVTGITFDDAAFSVFAPTFPLVVPPVDTTIVEIEFAPTEVRDYTATATVASDDAEEPTRTVALSGVGVDPEVESGDALWTYTVADNPATSFQDKKVSTIKSMGDVTGDGKADLVLGAENYLVIALNGNGWGTADTLWAFNTCYNNFDCGSVSGNLGIFETGLAAGTDFNGDGIGDVVFAVDGGGDRVTALDGQDGSIIWSLDTPDDPFLASYNAVAVRFDATGDGVPDVATCTGSASEGSADPFNSRRVYLLDGATGDEVWQAAPAIPNFIVEQFEAADGQRLVAAGGRDDNDVAHVTAYDAANGTVAWTIAPPIAPFVMAPYPLATGGEDLIYAGLGDLGGGGGLVRVDGETGEEVWSNFSFGSSVWDVVVLGDVNGDEKPDLALGSVLDNAYVLDGATGAVLWSESLGGQVFDVARVADVDDDGIAEVAATGEAGNAVLLSGADGEELWSYRIGNGTFDQSGEVIVSVPDIDGNGFPEVAVATRHGRVALLTATDRVTTDIDGAVAPVAFALDQNFPNPFRTTTTIRYSLAEHAEVQLTVYNLLGQRIRTLVSEEQAPGVQTVVWDGRSASGSLAAGVYLVRLQAGSFTDVRRMVLVR